MESTAAASRSWLAVPSTTTSDLSAFRRRLLNYRSYPVTWQNNYCSYFVTVVILSLYTGTIFTLYRVATIKNITAPTKLYSRPTTETPGEHWAKMDGAGPGLSGFYVERVATMKNRPTTSGTHETSLQTHIWDIRPAPTKHPVNTGPKWTGTIFTLDRVATIKNTTAPAKLHSRSTAETPGQQWAKWTGPERVGRFLRGPRCHHQEYNIGHKTTL